MADIEVQLKNTGKKNPKPTQENVTTPITTTTSATHSVLSCGKTAASSSGGKQPVKQLSTKEGGVTKEVLHILQEMNSNLNAQALVLKNKSRNYNLSQTR